VWNGSISGHGRNDSSALCLIKAAFTEFGLCTKLPLSAEQVLDADVTTDRVTKMRLLAAISVAILLFANQARGFALLGPYEDWMQTTNGFRDPYSLPFFPLDPAIGGPMDLHADYRWNVPVVTYAFDQAFVNYFGSNGVAAVERAIQIVNSLPPASGIVLTNYSFDSTGINFTAQSENLYDLTTVTLGLLVEQLGLGMPVQSIFVLKNFDRDLFTPFCRDEFCWYSWAYPDYIVQRHFDPETQQTTQWVNGVLYSAQIVDLGSKAVMAPFTVDPTAIGWTALADQTYSAGQYRAGFTYDDVGGLRYLYGTNNINFETLLPDVHGAGSNFNFYVNGAWRPGIEKITFVRQATNSTSGSWWPLTNQFDDVYITNGLVVTQRLERVVAQPDFLFSASDYNDEHSFWLVAERCGPANWLNLAALNGQTSQAGPGLIRPPGKIKFHRLGLAILLDDWPAPNTGHYVQGAYGSFDATTNVPIAFPALEKIPPDHFNMFLSVASVGEKIAKWRLDIPFGSTVALQISSNLLAWTTVGQVTNRGVECTWYDSRDRQVQFYRIVPQ